jgi:hypothetical protein
MEVATTIVNKFTDVMNEKQRTKFTSTDMFDITKELKFKILDQKKVMNPMIDH